MSIMNEVKPALPTQERRADARRQEQAPDPTITRPGAASRWLPLARLLSLLFSPISVSIPCVLLVALSQSTSALSALSFALLTLLFLSFGPLLYVIAGVRAGLLSDLDLSRRHERWRPFLVSLASCLVGLLLLLLLHAPRRLELLLATTLLCGLGLLLVTLWWKISIHTATLAGAATLLTALYGVCFLPAFLLLVPLGWSRVVLRRHTPAQVIGGALLSSALALGLLLLMGRSS
jgi:membrane-associated phospholipid phosphatase